MYIENVASGEKINLLVGDKIALYEWINEILSRTNSETYQRYEEIDQLVEYIGQWEGSIFNFKR